MNRELLTDSEYLVLGLVAEMPRHGYELEQVIEKRSMREWTQIGFSSIYFVLGKLEKKGLVAAATPENAKAKKSFSITKKGRNTLVKETLSSFEKIRSTNSPIHLGMLNWPVLSRQQSLESLQKRSVLVQQELERIEGIQFEQQPLPDFHDALFEYSINQLKAELKWLAKTLAYMQTKPWSG